MKYKLQKVQDPKHACRSIYKLVEITDGYDLIQIKRGYSKNLDLLRLEPGEPAFVLDTGTLYIGGDDGTPISIKSEDIRELEFKTFHEFPLRGEPDKLYIATDANEVYRYDSTKRAYVRVSYNLENLNCIDGGDSSWRT